MEPVTAAQAVANSLTVQGALNVVSTLSLFAYLNPYDSCTLNNSRYDYIVVGAGTSGSVVASRLSEDRNVKVLVLEAGSNFDIETVFPGLLPYTGANRLRWNYTALPDANYARCHRSSRYRPLVAKVIGGSTSLDYMLYSQGTENNYNQWAQLTNESSWAYPNVLRLFKKIEKYYNPVVRNSPDAKYHGFNGKLALTKDHSPANEKYYIALSQSNKKIVRDINNNTKLGVTGVIYYISNGTRQNSAQVYLTPARKRSNLYVRKNIQVTKILFDRNKRAVAVVAVTNDKKTFVFRADREIIIAGGTFNTPKLLQLSGVGTRELLNYYKIPAVSILPVGLNYQNRVATALSFATLKTKCKFVAENNNPGVYPSPTFETLASVNNSKVDAEYRSINFIIPVTPPTVLLQFTPYSYDFRNDVVDYWYKQNIGRENLFTLVESNYPKSRGQVRIQSLDPFVAPIIDTQHYSEESDIEDMVRYVKDYMQILVSPKFVALGAYFVDPTKGSCGSYENDGDDYWRCYIRCLMVPLSHHAGTAALGTVVDGRLRVKKVKGLRVADTSVMPELVQGSPSVPTMMIAENAAEMIKEDNK